MDRLSFQENEQITLLFVLRHSLQKGVGNPGNPPSSFSLDLPSDLENGFHVPIKPRLVLSTILLSVMIWKLLRGGESKPGGRESPQTLW